MIFLIHTNIRRSIHEEMTTTENREEFIKNAMPYFMDERAPKRALKRQEINRRLPYEVSCTGLGNYKARYDAKKLNEENKLVSLGTVYCNDVRDMEEMTQIALSILMILGLKENDKTEKDFDFLNEKITIMED